MILPLDSASTTHIWSIQSHNLTTRKMLLIKKITEPRANKETSFMRQLEVTSANIHDIPMATLQSGTKCHCNNNHRKKHSVEANNFPTGGKEEERCLLDTM
jgi:hypothetical protein